MGRLKSTRNVSESPLAFVIEQIAGGIAYNLATNRSKTRQKNRRQLDDESQQMAGLMVRSLCRHFGISSCRGSAEAAAKR